MHEHIHVRGCDFKQALRTPPFLATCFRTQLHRRPPRAATNSCAVRTGRWSASEFDQLAVKWRAGSQLTRRVTLTFDQDKELADHKALSLWM
jgi:hypothetical protein